MIESGDVVRVAAGSDRYLAEVSRGEEKLGEGRVTVRYDGDRSPGGSKWTTVPTELVVAHFKAVPHGA